MSSTSKLISDDYCMPFSLFNAFKHIQSKQIGDVEEIMDKELGRFVLKIVGSVSANNYVEFDRLCLRGPFVYAQLKLLSKVATIHFELLTSSQHTIRLTFSTLYRNDDPKYFGRSLRLPLPLETKWMVLHFNINYILGKYCSSIHQLETIQQVKKIQICSNLLVRDILTSSKPISRQIDHIPRELAAKNKASSEFIWVNEIGEKIDDSFGAIDSENIPSKIINIPSFSASADDLAKASKPSEKAEKISNSEQQSIIVKAPEQQKLSNTDLLINKTTTSTSKPRTPKSERSSQHQDGVKVGSPPPFLTPKRIFSPLSRLSTVKSNRNYGVDMSKSDKVLSINRVLNYDGGPIVSLYNGSLILMPSGKNMVLIDSNEGRESISGGFWKAFKFPGSSTSSTPWKLNDETMDETNKFQQSYLRGHSGQISILQTSHNQRFLASCENRPQCKLILWDIQEGKRLCTIQNCHDTVTTLAFNADCSMIVTVGLDSHCRVQIIVWDINILLLEQKKANTESPIQPSKDKSSNPKLPDTFNKFINDGAGRAIARQLSDFPISAISFSPYDANTLVSCGRENIRFWRLRKKHLPGRPIFLGEYSRGYSFGQIGFYNAPGNTASDTRKPCAYFSSNKGLLLKVDCVKEQIVCAFQLHSEPITAFVISHGFAVSGSNDCKIRVWPLDFSDFLIEAQYEGPISQIHVNLDGGKLLVGTKAGTLGILKVQEHNYKTILRSHVSSIRRVASCDAADEFATISSDRTIRVWNILNGQQKYEFSSTFDEPTTLTYHPLEHHIACGFQSGYVRIFDVESTSTIFERKHHKIAICDMLFIMPSPSREDFFSLSTERSILLSTVSMDGFFVLYDALKDYEPVWTYSFTVFPDVPISLAYDKPSNWLAVSTGNLKNICILDINQKHFILKEGKIQLSAILSEVNKYSTEDLVIFNDDLLESKVVGISFCAHGGSCVIVIAALEQSLIQIAFPLSIDTESNSIGTRLRQFLSTKRLHFGKAQGLTIDTVSGLALLPSILNPNIRNDNAVKSGSKPSSENQSEQRNSLCLVKIQSIDDSDEPVLQLFNAQVYDENPGNINCAIFARNRSKVISVDDTGAIIIWDINESSVDRLAKRESSPNENNVINVKNGTFKIQLAQSTSDQQLSNDEISAAEAESRQDDILADFQLRVDKDPSLWSARTVDTVKPPHHAEETFPFNSSGDEHSQMHDDQDYPEFAAKVTGETTTRLEDMFDESDDIVESPIEKTTQSDLNYNVGELTPTLHTSRDPLLRIDEIAKVSSSNSPIEIGRSNRLLVKDEETAHSLPRDDVFDQSPLNSPIFSGNHESFMFEDEEFDAIVDDSVLFNSKNSIPPLYMDAFNEIAISVHNMIVIKNLRASKDCFLQYPDAIPSNIGNIVALTASASGSIITSLFEEKHAETCTYCLLVWTRDEYGKWAWRNGAQLKFDDPDSSANGMIMKWNSFESEDYLVLTSLISSKGDKTTSVSISTISAHELVDGHIAQCILARSKSTKIPYSEDKPLDGCVCLFSSNQLLVWILNKVYVIDVSYLDENSLPSIIWVDDFGKRSISSVSNESFCPSYSLVTILDSLGDLRFLVFHKGNIQSINIRMDGSHISDTSILILLSRINTDINWKIKSSLHSNTASSSDALVFRSQPNKPFKVSIAQLIVICRNELRIYSAVIKETFGSKSLWDVKLHYLYSVKLTGVKVDSVSLHEKSILHDQEGDRFHLPVKELSSSLDSSIVLGWPINFIVSNKEGFLGIISSDPRKYPTTPQELTQSSVIQGPSILNWNILQYVSFGKNRKYLAYLLKSYKLAVVDNIRKTKIYLKNVASDIDIINSTTVIAGCSSYLALGTSRGHLVIIDGITISPICQYANSSSIDLTKAESLHDSTASASFRRKSVSDKLSDYTTALPTISDQSIIRCSFIQDEKAIVTINKGGEVNVFAIFSKSCGASENSLQLLQFTQFSPTIVRSSCLMGVFDCFQSCNIFGLVSVDDKDVQLFRLRSSASHVRSGMIATLTSIFSLKCEGEDITIHNMQAVKDNDSDCISLHIHGSSKESSGLFLANVYFPVPPDEKLTLDSIQLLTFDNSAVCVFSRGYAAVQCLDLIRVYKIHHDAELSVVYSSSLLLINPFISYPCNLMLAFEHRKKGLKNQTSLCVLWNDLAILQRIVLHET